MRMNPGLAAGYAEDAVAVDANGVEHVVVNWVVSDAEFEQCRQGYRCVNCMEPFPEPFPETCLICEFPVRSQQSERIARDYQGFHQYGATPDSVLDDQQAERDERAAWKQTDSGIVVPANLKGD